MLAAAVVKATAMKVPQCISVVDAGGHLLAFARMDGAFSMSMRTSLVKARTASCYGEPTGNILASVAWTSSWRSQRKASASTCRAACR
jgi:uncharacterized protein GlcG (DUF336 family)